MQVYFVNYDDIKEQIIEKIQKTPHPNPLLWSRGNNKNVLPLSPKGETEWGLTMEESNYELKIKSDYNNAIWFYSSDYSDILWMDYLSGFIQEFVPFFEKINSPLPQGRGGEVGSMMEIRTKSANIRPILDLWFIPKNTEFAFSLNPQELIEKYEKGTSSLEDRIEAINILLRKGYKVWLRFLPLLPVNNYKEIYTEFVEEIAKKIDMSKISSSFASGLLYTKKDYNVMLKKYPKLDVLYKLKEEKNNTDWFIREEREVRDFFYSLFTKLDTTCFICLDEV